MSAVLSFCRNFRDFNKLPSACVCVCVCESGVLVVDLQSLDLTP